VAYERRNRDLDPQLVWRGKDEQDWSDLVVQAPPLYIQEKVQPKVLIADLLRGPERLTSSSLPAHRADQAGQRGGDPDDDPDGALRIVKRLAQRDRESAGDDHGSGESHAGV
jgi:adenine-specific DNA-methyltransferase